MVRVCVLGATGFLGGHIARAAYDAGWQVVAVRRRPGFCGSIGDLGVAWREAELGDTAALRAAMSGCGVIFHAAGFYPQRRCRVDKAVEEAAQQIQHVLRCAREAGVERLIYTSSLSTVAQRYTPGMAALDERSHYRPGSLHNAYYEAKWAMERIALECRVPEVVALLPTAAFGPGDVKPTTGVVIREAGRGHIPVYFDAVINAVDGRDVAAAHIAAVARGRAGERYIIGGHNLSLRELLETVDRCQGCRRRRLRLPRGLIATIARAADRLPFLPLHDHIRAFEYWTPLCSQKAATELGHRPRPFEETVRDTLRWFGLPMH
ncbi:MAG: NAD-dependent epimerase/dehydratase family protein [Thermoflexales bacterium]